jgi:hypothetical protein
MEPNRLTAEQLFTEIKLHGPRSKPPDHPEFSAYNFLQDSLLRKPFIYNYSWAIPSPEAIAEIAAFIGDDKCLEIGAGRGLWAFLLKEAGVPIIATDPFPEEEEDCEIKVLQNTFDGGPPIVVAGVTGPTGSGGSPVSVDVGPENFLVELGFQRSDFETFNRQYFPVEKLNAQEAILKYQDYSCLFLCWGRVGYSPFAGSKIVFIGEDEGGCTTPSPDAEEWDCIKKIKIPQWCGLNDFLGLYRRKDQSQIPLSSQTEIAECSHIWDLVTPTAVFVQKYRCRGCSAGITSKDVLPCFHVWKKIAHDYGSNYAKSECLHCHQTEITMTV